MKGDSVSTTNYRGAAVYQSSSSGRGGATIMSSCSSSSATVSKSHLTTSSERFEVDQRAALFSTFGRKKRAELDREKYAAHSSAVMEAENDEHILDLEAKVHGLKDISLKLREETQESNTLLGNMSTQFDKVGGMLSGTMSRLKTLTGGASSRHIWYMMLFVVGIFFVMYVLYGRSKKRM